MSRRGEMLLEVRDLLRESKLIQQRIRELDHKALEYKLEKLTISELLEFERLLQKVVPS